MLEQKTIRILSYNIHKGFSPSNRKYIAEEIRNSIRLINADILFLQEVIGKNDKHKPHYHEWADDSQLEYLADSVWQHYAYGKNAIYGHGHHGNAILSKFPFSDWNNIDISFVKKSYRGILHGQLENKLQVMCTHFGLTPLEQNLQARQLSEEINARIQSGQAFILAGDFNDLGKIVHKKITRSTHLKECFNEQHQQLARTFPSRFPLFALDRIYYSGLELLKCEVLSGEPWSRLSDHCALFAEFKFPD